MNKSCIFLSKSNIELMTNLRECSRKYNIELSPCKHITEMLDLYKNGANAILIEKTDEFLKIEKYISPKILNELFFIQNNKIFNMQDALVYKTTEDFFKSNIFKNNIQILDANKIVTQKLQTLGIVFNNWTSRCIKLIVVEMFKQKSENVSTQILEMVAINNNLTLRALQNSIRPVLKQYTQLIKNTTKTSKVKEMINLIYTYCFN